MSNPDRPFYVSNTRRHQPFTQDVPTNDFIGMRVATAYAEQQNTPLEAMPTEWWPVVVSASGTPLVLAMVVPQDRLVDPTLHYQMLYGYPLLPSGDATLMGEWMAKNATYLVPVVVYGSYQDGKQLTVEPVVVHVNRSVEADFNTLVGQGRLRHVAPLPKTLTDCLSYLLAHLTHAEKADREERRQVDAPRMIPLDDREWVALSPAAAEHMVGQMKYLQRLEAALLDAGIDVDTLLKEHSNG